MGRGINLTKPRQMNKPPMHSVVVKKGGEPVDSFALPNRGVKSKGTGRVNTKCPACGGSGKC